MWRVTLLALILWCSLVLSACGRWAVDREIVWAQMGTPARIVDQREIQVLVSDGTGGWLPGRARLTGMVAIDEPTLLHYQRQESARVSGHGE